MRNSVVILSFLCGVLVVCDARAQQASSSASSIDPPSDQKLFLTLQGEGVQIYTCTVDNGTAAWKFLAPEAKLKADDGSEAGSHFAGPTWKLLDGSEVKGSMVASRPAPEAGAIPWLLLKVASKAGNGKLQAVQSITRTNTKGGVAPTTGCDAAHQGQQARVPYSATYGFYTGS